MIKKYSILFFLLIGIFLQGCLPSPQFEEFEIVKIHQQDGVLDLFTHTVIKDDQGNFYRIQGDSWGEPGDHIKVNINADYFWDN